MKKEHAIQEQEVLTPIAYQSLLPQFLEHIAVVVDCAL
jgi:hypothetical protein